MKKHFIYSLYLASLLYCSCASLQQPQGGPRDIEAPKVLKETPKNLTRNFRGDKIEIEFDEYFKLSSEFTEISVSPSMEIPPIFKTKQKSLEITFKDSLEKNTTYTVNFGKAIQDVNESNQLKNYSYVFSTGPILDSLQINGNVVSSADNKPVKDATVFIFTLARDTLFAKKRSSLYTTTDSAGNFSIKNLRNQKYTIYALKESSPDRIFNNANEEVAFLKDPINLTKDTGNIILKLFKEIPQQFRIIDRKIDTDGKILIIANKPINKPSITFLDGDIKEPIIEFSPKGDTTQIWLKDISFDSLKVSINSDNKPLDTLVFKRGKKDNYQRVITFGNNLSGANIRPGNTLNISFNIPIATIDMNKVELLEDSVPKRNFNIKKTENSPRKYVVTYPWLIKKRYTLSFQDNAIEDIYGTNNKAIKLDFELDEIENYGTLSLNVSKEDSLKNYVVLLLTEKNIIYKETPIKSNTTIVIKNIPTGKYTVKVVEDSNSNGEFDTGNVKLKIQPEKSWFYEKEIVTRANWDREEKIVIPKVF